MKRLLTFATVVAVCFAFSVPQADAGRKQQRHRWEGAAIGIGALMLGEAILHDIHSIHHRPPVYYDHEYDYRRYETREYCPAPPPQRGHWEEKKIWVPPIYERVWNPGHYTHRNEWVPGNWMRVEKQPGYWEVERVWISHR